jgi:hypothetical protein
VNRFGGLASGFHGGRDVQQQLLENEGISINNPSYTSSGSSLSNFFKYVGIKTLAGLAHPTNTFKSGTFDIYSNSIVVNIKYFDGYYTKLRITKKNNLFTAIEVISDNDWASPFIAISIVKELADEAMKNSEDEDKDETKSKLEKELGKMYYEFDGIDISLFILNLDWAAY